jgi:predicted metal-dependent hydrolase
MTRPDFRHGMLSGIDRFNRMEFWEAHEAWEELWLQAQSDVHQFLQGLIQVAAAYHHVKRGTFPGAVRLFEAGLKKLQPFPPLYCGIDRDGLVTAARQHQQWTAQQMKTGQRAERLRSDEFPRIVLVPDWTSRLPLGERW